MPSDRDAVCVEQYVPIELAMQTWLLAHVDRTSGSHLPSTLHNMGGPASGGPASLPASGGPASGTPASRSEMQPGCALQAALLSVLQGVAVPMQRPRPSKSQLQRASLQVVPSVKYWQSAGVPSQPTLSL